MSRRQQILDTAADLFARHGYHGVSITDLGRAVGISGPALYKHFDSKPAILAEMLTTISDELLSEGKSRVAAAASDEEALRSLIDWHVSFALAHPALIIVQDRDWDALPGESRERVRDTQRRYVATWVGVVRRLRPDWSAAQARARVHAVFGLINSTPHSAHLPAAEMHPILADMAFGALSGS